MLASAWGPHGPKSALRRFAAWWGRAEFISQGRRRASGASAPAECRGHSHRFCRQARRRDPRDLSRKGCNFIAPRAQRRGAGLIRYFGVAFGEQRWQLGAACPPHHADILDVAVGKGGNGLQRAGYPGANTGVAAVRAAVTAGGRGAPHGPRPPYCRAGAEGGRGPLSGPATRLHAAPRDPAAQRGPAHEPEACRVQARLPFPGRAYAVLAPQCGPQPGSAGGGGANPPQTSFIGTERNTNSLEPAEDELHNFR